MAARLLARAALGALSVVSAGALSLGRGGGQVDDASLGGDGYPRGLSRAVSLLGSRADRLHSPELAALALRASQQISSRDPDALEHVKGMLRNMLASAMDDHAASVDRARFCQQELPKSKERLSTLQDRVEKSQADFDKLTAVTDELKDSTTELFAQLAADQKSAVKATEIRAKDHEAYAAQKAAYEKQQDQDADAALKTRVKAETAEAAKDLAFRRMQSELKEGLVRKERQVQENQRLVIRKTRDISEMQQDLRGLQEELAASKTYEEQVAHQCTVPASSAADRKARREGEIGSLKDAYQILSGDGIPVLSF